MRALLLALFLLLPFAARAQSPANLIADSLTITPEGQLRATGDVVAWFDGYRLSASAITYDPATENLTLAGPLLITGPDGTILTGDTATLDADFRNAILTGARLVLDRQLQLAAAQITRIDGRFTTLDIAAVTSCQVCAGRAPLWEIRADRVVHDEIERQLHFDNARLLVRGVPVLWLPAMRLPDPTLDRARGLLIPDFRTSDQLGLGLRLPYFLPLGPSRDLTLTPWLSAQTTTLQFRYRQAFTTGRLTVAGAFGRDSLRPGDWRGYLMADGSFDLGRDVTLGFDIESVSDAAYLYDYDLSDQDRLASRVTLRQIRDASLLIGDLTWFESLRPDEDNRSLPPLTGSLLWKGRSPLFGGTLTLDAGAEGFVRPDAELGETGRDMARLATGAEWRADRILGPGLLAETAFRLTLEAHAIGDDPDTATEVLRAVPQGALTLRWPLVRAVAGGGGMLLEPVASLGWGTIIGDDIPNEDSRLVEFDEGNLLAFTRFPGTDAVEEGLRAALGVNWTRTAPGGTEVGLTFGRLLHDRAADVTSGSGLAGLASDWLIAAHLDLAGGFRLDARTLVGDDLSIGRTEGRLDWTNPRLSLGAAYVFLPADADENRPEAASEWTLDALYRFDAAWEIRADARYDIAQGEPARAGFGIAWRNECVTVDLSVARRYTSSTIVDPSTTFGLTVNLNGFSTGRSIGPVAGSCG
jgi:LPS-assembly protein